MKNLPNDFDAIAVVVDCVEPLGRGDKIVAVADALDISHETVAGTTSLLKQKLGVKNHSDLIRIAVEVELD